ncbi:MAG: hypothetical protein ACO3NL_10905, partial [Phycisphaerales bacterium]
MSEATTKTPAADGARELGHPQTMAANSTGAATATPPPRPIGSLTSRAWTSRPAAIAAQRGRETTAAAIHAAS